MKPWQNFTSKESTVDEQKVWCIGETIEQTCARYKAHRERRNVLDRSILALLDLIDDACIKRKI